MLKFVKLLLSSSSHARPLRMLLSWALAVKGDFEWGIIFAQCVCPLSYIWEACIKKKKNFSCIEQQLNDSFRNQLSLAEYYRHQW